MPLKLDRASRPLCHLLAGGGVVFLLTACPSISPLGLDGGTEEDAGLAEDGGAPPDGGRSDAGTQALKDPCRGILPENGMGTGKYAFLDSAVFLVNWSQLETSDGGPDGRSFSGPGWAQIDQQLLLAEQRQGHLRLRIMAGT